MYSYKIGTIIIMVVGTPVCNNDVGVGVPLSQYCF